MLAKERHGNTKRVAWKKKYIQVTETRYKWTWSNSRSWESTRVVSIRPQRKWYHPCHADCWNLYLFSVPQPDKAFFKVGPDAGPQPIRVRQNPKLLSAPPVFPQWGHLRRQETKQQTIGKTIGEVCLTLSLTCIYVVGRVLFVKHLIQNLYLNLKSREHV